MPRPSPDAPINPWRLYVAAGESREERNRRLDECPEDYREEVRRWVKWFFEDMRKAREGRNSHAKKIPSGTRTGAADRSMQD
jgi:hypothetical protein